MLYDVSQIGLLLPTAEGKAGACEPESGVG